MTESTGAYTTSFEPWRQSIHGTFVNRTNTESYMTTGQSNSARKPTTVYLPGQVAAISTTHNNKEQSPSPLSISNELITVTNTEVNDEDQQNPDLAHGKCMCCSSELRYQETVSRFRCPECDTVNDLKPHIRKQPNEPITFRQLKRTVAKCSAKEKAARREMEEEIDQKNLEKYYEPVEKMVEMTFGSWVCLNHSFLNDKETSLEDSGLNMTEIRDAYRILLSLPVNVIRGMMTATDKLLKRPSIPLRRMSDIRFLLIILENPLLSQYNFQAETKHHHNLLKRIFGILSCLNNECHQGLVNWFAKYTTEGFSNKIHLVHMFITYRVTRAQRSRHGLPAAYESDWKISSAARTMALLFAANHQSNKLPISDFYNTMIDYINLLADFESWQSRSGKFAFCQYPFLISMGAKMQILEADAKRQMETKWREAFFNMLFHQKASMPYLVLRVRRENLIEDSLRQLAQNELDLKKSLRIEFVGEEGVDAGGLRKEWFLLLVRSLFDPQYGMFTYDEDANLCWFNPTSFENEGQYFLVGIVLGLAIYNSTILDIHLPTACYKKLLGHPVDISDLEIFRPGLARGLRQLLEFEGDVESTFCRAFVAEVDAFGQRQSIDLISEGSKHMVTNENRQHFVDLYVNHVLNSSVERQFGAFRRGFYHVCGGNALSLFRPQEIELLVRGSDEPLEIDDLCGQTEYQGFDQDEDTIQHFWSIMKAMDPSVQRKLLMFVTGSDRIPATGATQMNLKIACGGEDCNRLPSAHTCFNQLVLYRYETKEKLEHMLKTAIMESQGFYVK
ncbi:hypothetical protein INT45_004704 [Circinella minor]|uniref:HECT-type E3 ubiquitin transferase n=1 Tax=Circinella minor TaxID=1195481 RepID=A0A8H7VQI9_9FUNG|nr:hypothetical protein INT45_004704 [Circinella minor]